MKNFLTKTKSIFTIFALALILIFSGVFVACSKEDPANAVALDKTTVQIAQYETVTLNVSVSGSLNEDDVVWSTSDESVAAVVDGVVMAVSLGDAEITATIGKYSAKCAVKVVEQTNIAKVSLSQYDATLRVGGSVKVNGSIVYRGKAVEGAISWSSTDENIVRVENGTLTGVSAGRAFVTATATYQDELISASVDVTVKEEIDLSFGTTKVYLKTNEVIDPNKTTYQFAPEIHYNGEASAEYAYESTDESVITVTDSGLVTAVGAGDAYVVVYATVTSESLQGAVYCVNIAFNVEKSTYTLAKDNATFEVYSGISGTTPTANAYSVNLSKYGLKGDENTTVSLTANGKTSTGATTLANSNGTVVISGNTFGGKIYGNVKYTIETKTATLYGEIDNVVTKYLDDQADLENMFFYGGIQENVSGKPYDGYFIMKNNILLKDWPVLANRDKFSNNTNYEGTWGFQGIFDGQGYTIDNLFAFGTFGGIFGNVGIDATVKNLGVKANLRPTYSNGYRFNPYVFALNFTGRLQNVYVDVTIDEGSGNPNGGYYPIASNLTHAKLKDVVVKFDASIVSTMSPSTNPSKPTEVWTPTAGLLCGQLGQYKGTWVYGAELSNVHVFYKGPDCKVGSLYTMGSTAYPYDKVSGIVQYGYDESATIPITDATYWDMTGAQPIFKSAK